MSLISTFHAGPVSDVAAAIRDRPATADEEFPSAHASGLFQPGIDDACRELGKLRGKRPQGLKRYVAEVLDGDGEESQVVRLAPAFVKAFATLTDAEASEISRRLVEKEAQEDRSSRARLVALASKPIQSRLDVVALMLMPVLGWHFALRFGARMTVALVVGATVGIAFLALTFVVLPWVRRRKIPPERPSRADGTGYVAELRDLAELCRKAERERLDLVYEWSL
jgi:hypothetical protein